LLPTVAKVNVFYQLKQDIDRKKTGIYSATVNRVMLAFCRTT